MLHHDFLTRSELSAAQVRANVTNDEITALGRDGVTTYCPTCHRAQLATG